MDHDTRQHGITRAAADFWLIVPVKDTGRGKSRLQLPANIRSQVAMAMAMDTVTAAASVARVLAVVEDRADGAALAAIPGVSVHLTSVRGLNESIIDGLRHLTESRALQGPVATLPADLPGLIGAELADALAECAGQQFSVVADRQGVGTTLLAAADAAHLIPWYGPDSFALHRAEGATPVTRPVSSSLRRDVDTREDLIGNLGPHTRQVLAATELATEPATEVATELPGVPEATAGAGAKS